MNEQFARTEMLIGADGVARLRASSVIVFGVGGVGSYVAEGLARAGIGRLTLVDKDVIDETNINRQLPALHSTVGQSKAKTMAERIRDINPRCRVESVECFFLPENAHTFDFRQYDYVVDAIDTVTGKLALIEKAYREGVQIISSMGTGNKLNPSLFQIAAIEKTKVCPLARVMRKELKDRGIRGVKVLYSEEPPVKPGQGKNASLERSSDSLAEERSAWERRTSADQPSGGRKATPGSISFVPSVAGLLIAGEVARDLLGAAAQ